MASLAAFSILMLLSMTQANLLTDTVDKMVLPRYPRAVEEKTCSYNPCKILESPVRIGSWNVQRLGWKKVKDPEISRYIAQVITRYDIIALQEISDKSGEAIYEMLRIVNEVAYFASEDYDPGDHLIVAVPQIYNVTVSERVGRTSYKEQYAFFYRTDIVSLRESMLYLDPHENFTYDPFIAVFNTPTIDLETITIVTIHASPALAAQEIDSLIKIYEYVNQELNLDDIMFLGDFNAGCSYVTSKAWEILQLFLDERFTWLISDHVDTTTKYTTCPYDRIVITGENLTKITYENTAKAFHYDDELNITDLDVVTAISDHFPVEVLLKAKSRTTLIPSLSISVGPVHYSEELLRSYVGSCQDTINLESELLDAILNCSRTKIYIDKQKILGGLHEAFKLHGNDYVNRTADEYADRKCLENNWAKKYSDLEESLSICGTKPYYTLMGGNIKQLGFKFANTEQALDFLESLGTKRSCLFKDEVYAVLKQKLHYGVLQDPSSFMEDISEHRTLNLWCMDSLCFISVTADLPIM